jgi:hypothetical protein
MLSGQALDLAFALRSHIGPLVQGDGPEAGQLRQATGLPQADFDRALTELESVGFISLARPAAGEVTIVVLAPLQIYLDDLENQGTDDF